MQQMQSPGPRLIAVGPIGPDMANATIMQGPYPFMGSAQQMQQVQQIFQGQGMPYPHGMQMNGKAHGGTGTRSGVCASRHMAAEQRRRARINERLEALRSLVPHSARANTAAFLEEVYEYISALHKQLERLGGGPFATPGPSPPTAMLDPPANGKASASGTAGGGQITGSKRDRSTSEESDMQTGSEEMAGGKSQFAPFLQASLLPGSPLFGATTSSASNGTGMVMPELSLRSIMSEGPRPVAPPQQVLGTRVVGNGFAPEVPEGVMQRGGSPGHEQASTLPHAGENRVAIPPGPSENITLEADHLEAPPPARTRAVS